ncbi:phosphate ABC transporter permease subunit PstC [Nitratifractor sp.]
MFNRLFRLSSYTAALLVLVILAGIFGVLYYYARDAIHDFGFWHFITTSTWEVGEDDEGGVFGGLIPILGTLFSTGIAMLFAVPIAMGIAVFLTEIATEKLKAPVGIAIELLAAIPSIIYGMWGLFYFGPMLQRLFGGQSNSLLTAGLVLGIMVIPFMAAISRDAINTTPAVLKESAYAMGATRFEVVKDVIFPYAKRGIIGSMVLSLGRALGETMAVAFVIGGVFRFPHSLTQPTISIPVLLANNFAEAGDLELSAMFYMALILFGISFITITIAKFFFLKDQK